MPDVSAQSFPPADQWGQPCTMRGSARYGHGILPDRVIGGGRLRRQDNERRAMTASYRGVVKGTYAVSPRGYPWTYGVWYAIGAVAGVFLGDFMPSYILRAVLLGISA